MERRDSPRPWIKVFLFLESVVLPLAFLYFAGAIVWGFLKPLDPPRFGKDTLLGASGVLLDFFFHPEKAPEGVSRIQIYSWVGFGLIRPAIAFLFDILCAALIILRTTNVRYVPSSAREIFVPIAGTFLLLLLPLSQFLPGRLGQPMSYPPDLVITMTALPAVLAVCGGALAVYGILYLRRNFSIFVEVREIVLSGPYRYIRHPLYTGEIALITGVVLIRPTVFGLFLVALEIVFQYMRAKMEEARLAESSPEYAARMLKTGMFFPRLIRR
ncbi:methyltransferase family protein [Candidatus Eisenbacteria bacterium]|uniref:Methyltransferase family protein n=1 Tax=Eiseniibacteriota bacterium TaxID=2212470 RepID=A0ABV6YIY6_UNCEI